MGNRHGRLGRVLLAPGVLGYVVLDDIIRLQTDLYRFRPDADRMGRQLAEALLSAKVLDHSPGR